MNLKPLQVVLIAFLWSFSVMTIAEDCKVSDSDLQGSYEGNCKNGKADGYGIATGKDRYEGDFALGRPHGKGSYIWADGERYDGEFLNGRISGKGSYKYSNGDRYDGEFSDGLRSGKGTHIYASGKTLSAEWRNNKPVEDSAQNGSNEINQLRAELDAARRSAADAESAAAKRASQQSQQQSLQCYGQCQSSFASCQANCQSLSDQSSFLQPSPRHECWQICVNGKDYCENGC